jgi:predicted nucleotidyltransferase
MPKKAYATLNEYLKNNNLPKKETLSDIVLYSIRTSLLSEVKNTFDVKEGLENRIKDVAKNCTNIEEYFEKVATKRYQAAKLRRIVTHLLLGIKEEDVLSIYKYKMLPYIKVLATNKKILSSSIKCNTTLIVRNDDTKNISKEAKRLIEIEDRTEQVYSLLTGRTTTIPYLLQTSIVISF